MGPRLVGRGKVYDGLGNYMHLTGFNGAASCGTRKENLPERLPLRVTASMGPRLVGRGKAGQIIPSGPAYDGFNGAASCGTRKVRFAPYKRNGPSSFNGAASCGTRKVHRSARRAFRALGFNGAASCGTRKEGGDTVYSHSHLASMGPRLVGRGKR